MGYRDYKLCLCDSQAVTADADCTNYIDTELTYPGWHKGMPAQIVIIVETKTTAGTGITFRVVHKTAEPSNNDILLCSVTALAADLAVGDQITITLPGGIELLRYVRMYFDVTAGTESYVLSAYFQPLTAQ